MEDKKITLEFKKVKEKAPIEKKLKTEDKKVNFPLKGIFAGILNMIFLIGAVVIEIQSIRGEVSPFIATCSVAIFVVCSLIVTKISKKQR